MRKPVKISIYSGFILIFIAFFIWAVWGQSIRNAWANHFFKTKAYDKAETIYEDLAVDLPRSPMISHNIGLCLYQAGLYERAVDSFSKALPKTKELSQKPSSLPRNTGVYYYHLGNALYKAASRKGIETEPAVKLFTAALDNYKKALLADSEDGQARYNYELTVLHLKELATKPQTQQNEQQETDNLMQNTQNSEQYKAKFIQENNPPGGKDW